MLAMSQKISFDKLHYPTFASVKMDGLRCLIYEGQLFTRNLKLHPNQQLTKYLKQILAISRKHDMVFDGELWDASLPFCETASILRSYNSDIEEGLAFHVFDCMERKVYDHGAGGLPFEQRKAQYTQWCHDVENVVPVVQLICSDKTVLEYTYRSVITQGHEGIICRDPRSYYKHGRVTPGKPTMVKFKATETHDARIIDILPARKLKAGVERTTDLMGHLKKVHTQDSYEESDLLGSFVVDWNGNRFSVGTGRGLDNSEKRRILANKADYIGKWLEFESLSVGVKDVPRMGKFTRFRLDKEDQ